MQASILLGAKDLVRLHVLADSDRDRAQRVKMGVVGDVRRTAASLCQGAQDADEAFLRLVSGASAIRKSARRAAWRRLYFGRVRVETGYFSFPDRIYGKKYAPAGEYRAVRVLLGRGAGRNWWCVLYPELCVLDAVCQKAVESGLPIRFYASVARAVAQFFGGGAGV